MAIEIPPEAIKVPDGASYGLGTVIDDLLHYCGVANIILPIEVVIDEGEAVVVRRLEYLDVAKKLGKNRIQAILRDPPSGTELEKFCRENDSKVVSLSEVVGRDMSADVVMGWHVFRFKRRVSEREAQAFYMLVDRVFCEERLGTKSRRWCICDFSLQEEGSVIQFRAPTPTNNHSWAAHFLAELNEYNLSTVKISTYQGIVFAG